jgi:exopolyphosphatase / guanosine-5'-triphosphate,3'-diphosphate pyrophosphatase
MTLSAVTWATAVLRKTGFPEDFVRPAEEMLKAPIEIITGEEEAILTCTGAVLGIPVSSSWVVMDVGGQSTEVGYKEAGEWRGVSLDFGVVSLTERFVPTDPPTADEIAQVGAEVARILDESLPAALKGNLLGVAGTATTLGMLSIGAKEWSRDKVHGLSMTLEDVVYWKNQMAACTSKERTDKYRVRPLRADVFPSGICIMEEMIRFLGKDSFTISANGLRIGLAMSLLKSPRSSDRAR